MLHTQKLHLSYRLICWIPFPRHDPWKFKTQWHAREDTRKGLVIRVQNQVGPSASGHPGKVNGQVSTIALWVVYFGPSAASDNLISGLARSVGIPHTDVVAANVPVLRSLAGMSVGVSLHVPVAEILMEK